MSDNGDGEERVRREEQVVWRDRPHLGHQGNSPQEESRTLGSHKRGAGRSYRPQAGSQGAKMFRGQLFSSQVFKLLQMIKVESSQPDRLGLQLGQNQKQRKVRW